MSGDRGGEEELVRANRALTASVSQAGVRVGIGDDCAVLETQPGVALLATTDLLLEDVHFRRRWAEPADIGWKSLAVNLSDIAAMGGRPRWALVALAWAVFAPATLPRGALAGPHTGATAGGTVGAGASANVLVGGPDRRIIMQPASVQGQTGVNIAAGVSTLELRPATAPARRTAK